MTRPPPPSLQAPSPPQPSPPLVDYQTPRASDAVRVQVDPGGGLILYDAAPPVWQLILIGISLPIVAVIALVFIDIGGPLLLAAVIPLGLFALQATVFLDDLVQHFRPAVVEVRGGVFLCRQLRWYGSRVRQCPVQDVRDVLVARSSVTVWAPNDLLIRFHRGPSVSVLHCRSLAEAHSCAEALRASLGLNTPYAAPSVSTDDK